MRLAVQVKPYREAVRGRGYTGWAAVQVNQERSARAIPEAQNGPEYGLCVKPIANPNPKPRSALWAVYRAVLWPLGWAVKDVLGRGP